MKLLQAAESRLGCLSRDLCSSRASIDQGATAVPGHVALLLLCVASATFIMCPLFLKLLNWDTSGQKSMRGLFGLSGGELYHKHSTPSSSRSSM